jgi:hypothetical protein
MQLKHAAPSTKKIPANSKQQLEKPMHSFKQSMRFDAAFGNKLSLCSRLRSLDKAPIPFCIVSLWESV